MEQNNSQGRPGSVGTDVLESAQFERHNEGLALIEKLLDFDAKTLLAILKQVKLTLLQVNNIPYSTPVFCE